MKVSGIASGLLLLLQLTAPALAIAEEVPPQGLEKLSCGTAEVTVQAQCFRVADQERQCRTQSLHLRNPGLEVSNTLAHEGKAIKQPFVHDGTVLDAIATGWACVHAIAFIKTLG